MDIQFQMPARDVHPGHGSGPLGSTLLGELVRARKLPVDVADAEDPALMAREIQTLGQHQTLVASGSYRVIAARRYQIPSVVYEIGRLRELSFRAAGEGTGLRRDLDAFDEWYTQLFVWDVASKQVLGAYRLSMTDVVIKRFGQAGLYTDGLFHYSAGFFERLGPALELGRSFVRLEFQRAPRVLALLWKGIGRFVAQRPQYRTLIGPVSVSANYSSQSRAVIAQSLMLGEHRHPLSGLVAARCPLPSPVVSERVPKLEMKDLSDRVAQQEADGKGLPVLVREYLRLGGRFLSFSIDPDFADAMDGLVCVHLDETDPRLLRFYMGDEQLAAFQAARLE